MGRGPLVARVLPNVAGLDKEFDYQVPPELARQAQVGSVVRVPLHGRKVQGWVTSLPAGPPDDVVLLPLDKVIGWGPEPELLAMADWAAWRWAGRRRSLMVSASAGKAVRQLPPRGPSALASLRPPPRRGAAANAGALLLAQSFRPGAQVLRLAPAAGATELVMAAAERGPVLVVAPTTARAEVGCTALRGRGEHVALLPQDWALARAGAQVVIGARAAAWGPCPGMASVVVLDAHDEALVQEQAPTWDAPNVAAERARRAGVPCLWVTPCPTVELLEAATCLYTASRSEERAGWAAVRVADLRQEDPRSGLYSSALVDLLRTDDQRRVVCVLNRKGRARLLDCASCGDVATCELCTAAVAMLDEELACQRCRARRPVVCATCGSDALRLRKPGVARVREQVEALAGRPTGEVAAGRGPLPATPVLVGTEAVLYRDVELRRGGGVGAVAFLDFDQELLASRYRAGEQALALLARASRLVGGRAGTVLVQTRAPSHPVINAAVQADPGRLVEAEEPVRKALRLPPFSALALISGPGAGELAGMLARLGALELSQLADDRWVVRAPGYPELADALAAVGRPGGRTRVEVGPVRF